MRSLMLVLGTCLVALSFAGCSSTGGCNGGGGFLGGGLLGGGMMAGNGGCSGGCGDTSCSGGCGDTACSGGCGQTGQTACSGGCGDSACSGGCGQNNFLNKRYGGQSGLGLGLMEAGPSCTGSGCNGGCQSCRRANRPPMGSRIKSRLQGRMANRGCGCGGGGGMDCGCGESPTPAPVMPETGCGAPVETDCGCAASGPAGFSMTDIADIGSGYDGGASDGGGIGSGFGGGDNVQLASHEGPGGGLLGKLFGHRQVRGHQGCGVRGCGGPGGLCSRCRARLAGAFGAGGSIPHRDPTIHSGGGAAGPAGQIPTYAYPYYTTRAPRDFLDPNPPTIGY